MKDPNYQQICKTLLDASEGTPLTKLWKEEYFKKNEKKFGPLVGLDRVDLDSLIKTPANFDLIEREIEKLQMDKITDHLTVKEGKFVPSESFDRYIESKTHHYAEGAEQIERLKLANNLIEAFRALEGTLLETFEDVPAGRAKRRAAVKTYVPECPVFIKRVEEREFSGGFWHVMRVELYPNPKFIKNGFGDNRKRTAIGSGEVFNGKHLMVGV